MTPLNSPEAVFPALRVNVLAPLPVTTTPPEIESVPDSSCSVPPPDVPASAITLSDVSEAPSHRSVPALVVDPSEIVPLVPTELAAPAMPIFAT